MRKQDAKHDLVGAIPGMEQRDRHMVEQLSRLVDIADVDAGHVLIREGAWGAEAFVVVHGEAAVTSGGDLIATVGPGEWLGEAALLRHTRRSATVTALTPMTLLVMSVQQFRPSSSTTVSPVGWRRSSPSGSRRPPRRDAVAGALDVPAGARRVAPAVPGIMRSIGSPSTEPSLATRPDATREMSGPAR